MAYKADVRTTFEPNRVIQPIYTGGAVSLSRNGRILASTLGEEALLTDLTTGASLARIEGDGEPLTTLALTPDASYLVLCSRSLSMRIYALQQSAIDDPRQPNLLKTLKPHDTPIVTIAVNATGELLATGGADGTVMVWDVQRGYRTHTFHGHSGVISALHFFQIDPESEDPPAKSKKRKSKRWNEAEEVRHGDTAGFRLASGGEDGKVRIWDLHKSKSIATLDAHVSVVRSLGHSPEQGIFISASRDKTVVLWDPTTWQQGSTVAVLETIESAGFVEEGRFFFTAGETARLRIWDTENGNELSEDQDEGSEVDGIVDVQYGGDQSFILTVHADQTLILRSLKQLTNLQPTQRIPPLPILKRISGTHDEVIDLAYIGLRRNLLALATNLEDIRIISLDTDSPSSSSYFGADVALLKGHDDIVITLDTDWSGCWLATGAKDNTARLWRLDPDNDSYTCYATFTGHAESIGAVSLPNAAPSNGSKEYERPLEHPPKFLITGSQDKTIKRWDISQESGKTPRAAYTRKAHDKDINAIGTSYSAQTPLFASASQDRTVKIWDVLSGEAIGVLRGHKRGVWSVAFSPVSMPSLTTMGEGGSASSAKGMVVTGSGDKTIKIWSLADYSCLRTFEGHANSVLKVVWLPPPDKENKRGVQVASAAGDGLVKVWDAQTSECVATLDNHIDRVWALAVKPAAIVKFSGNTQSANPTEDQDRDGQPDSKIQVEIVSGSADSTLTFWHDTTTQTALLATTQAIARIEQDQSLQNAIRSLNYREAIVLALQLNHPKRLLEIFKSAAEYPTRDDKAYTGNKEVDEVLSSLSDSQLWTLLRRIRDWNANGRTHYIAQRLLYALLRLFPKERILALRKRRKALAVADTEENLVHGMSNLSTKDKVQSRESVRDVLDGLRAYSERHVGRLEKVGEERFVLLWALGRMDDVSGVNGLVLNGDAGNDRRTDEDVIME